MVEYVISPLLKLLGINCRSAFDLSSQQMDRALSARESIRLRVHMWMCGLCRNMSAQFEGMRKLIKACEQENHMHCGSEKLSGEAKHRIAQHLKKQS
jgi:predicted anti-sigma-YlaC factor YlaD